MKCGKRYRKGLDGHCPACGPEGVLDIELDLASAGRTLTRKALASRPRDLWRASMEVVKREGKPASLPGVRTDGPLILQEGAVVEAGATLHGPVFLASGSRVARGCIVSNACVYEGSAIDADATVTNSIVLEQSRIGARCEITDSVVATSCRIEEDVRLVSSLIGDDMTVKAHSRLENATVSPPAE